MKLETEQKVYHWKPYNYPKTKAAVKHETLSLFACDWNENKQTFYNLEGKIGPYFGARSKLSLRLKSAVEIDGEEAAIGQLPRII